MLSRRSLLAFAPQFFPPETPVTFDGTLKGSDKKYIVVEKSPDQTVQLELNRKTKIVDASGKPLSKLPEPGTPINVDGVKQRNGVLLALVVKVL